MTSVSHSMPTRPVTLVRPLAALVLLVLLAGCAGYEWRPGTGGRLWDLHVQVPADAVRALSDAPSCCASLADLPFAPLDLSGRVVLDIDERSPAFAFETGKSFFAAFRLPDGPRPLEVSVKTRMPLAAFGPGRPIFNPALAVLDAHHRVVRLVHEPEDFAVRPPVSEPAGVEVAGVVYIGEAPEQAACLVVLTTDDLRTRRATPGATAEAIPGAMFVGVTLEGFSPVGIVELAVRSMPFLQPPVRFRASARWVGPDRPIATAAAELLSLRDHRLYVDATAVRYAEEQDGHYVERLAFPFDRVVSVQVDYRLLTGSHLLIDTAASPDAPTVRYDFELSNIPGEPGDAAKAAERVLAAAIRPGWYREPVAIVAGATVPLVVFRESPHVPAPAGERILADATAGGVATASVCALCQFGGCTPEILLGCAGLFAVGAAVGGAVSTAGELLSGGFAPPPQPPSQPTPEVDASTSVLRAASDTLLAQDALRACALRRAAGAGFWVEQGRAATLAAEPAQARFVVQTVLDRVELRAKGEPGQSPEEVPVQLVAEGTVVFRDASQKSEERRTVRWEGPTHVLAQWSGSDRTVLETSLRAACDGLAGGMLDAAASFWRQPR